MLFAIVSGFQGHTDCVNFLRFSPDGKWIASAGEDGLIKV